MTHDNTKEHDGAEKTDPDPYVDLIRERMVKHVDSLLWNHLSPAMELARNNDPSSVTISVSFKLELGGKVPHLVTKIRYAKPTTDESEAYIEDPKQLGLPV